jgi:outer membrane protein assembly factor BamE
MKPLSLRLPALRHVRPQVRLVARFWGVCALISLGGCANSFLSDGIDRLTPYRVEIVQGNVVTREQVALVRPGMAREQVRNVLGAPLLTDLFHASRWDYVFSLRRGGDVVQRKTVTAWFDGDVLKTIDAPNDLPSENDFVASLPIRRVVQTAAPKLELSAEERSALPAPSKREAAPAAPVGALRPFPPLEPNP